MRQRQAGRVDPGNAPPMRALPLAFLARARDRERLSVENADATHPHPKARAASLLVATGCRFYALKGGAQAELLQAAVAQLEVSSLAEPETIAHLRALDQLPDYHDFGPRFARMPREVHALLCGPQPCPFTLGKVPAGADGTAPMHGLYSDSMRTAGAVLYLCKWQRGPLDALTASVDLGGDVDSVAALCLGIVAAGPGGLRFGEAGGLPWRLLEELEGVEYLLHHARAFEAWLQQQPGAAAAEPDLLLPPARLVSFRSRVSVIHNEAEAGLKPWAQPALRVALVAAAVGVAVALWRRGR
eukprot:Transcript_25974.p1 GENE.Transcript_25974~~Transcript_25974.p1  ORF type:complete len:300 (-),score=115.85 Transcript_25974:67-966(-)